MKLHKAKSKRNHIVNKVRSNGISNTPLFIGIGAIVLLLAFYIFTQKGEMVSWLSGVPAEESGGATPTASMRPKPSPRLLNPGKETFQYAPGPKAKGPKIYEFSLDPLGVKPGVTQTITVKATHTSPITSVTARLDTDTKKTPLTFTRIAGTDTNGTWQATRISDDTYNEIYYLDFTLVGTDETYTGGFAFR